MKIDNIKLIDADKLIRWLEVRAILNPMSDDKIEAYSECITRIAAMETAEPVRHGRWIKPHWRNNVHCANCSECGSEAQHLKYHGVEELYNFCPFCGARMNVKEDKDNE